MMLITTKRKHRLAALLLTVCLFVTFMSAHGGARAAAPDEWLDPFTDVTESNWFYDDVRYAVDNDLFKGTGEKTFSPNVPMTRAMLVTVLWRFAGSPFVDGGDTFADVPTGVFYYDPVCWASANGIVRGVGGGLFGSETEISRQDLAVILLRRLNQLRPDMPITADFIIFTDEESIADYAKGAMQTMFKLGIITGRGNNSVDPTGTATRAEVAAIMHRFSELL